MKKLFSENIFVQLIFLCLTVFLSRLPFLWAGFGAEEDSWLMPLTARHIALTGEYQMSRAPGHPLQELIYALIWSAGPLAYNIISAIASVVATLFFALALKQLKFKHYLYAAFAFAFTPIVFISSTYTIDYMLAMAFVMGSFYCITTATPPLLSHPKGEKPARAFPPFWGGTGWGALFLGIAIGFRLTSAAMLLPFCILLLPISRVSIQKIMILVSITTITGLLVYFPVLKTYGLSFFDYSDQFPYPNLPKVIYKATFGVFGFIGILAILFAKSAALKRIFSQEKKIFPSELPTKFFWASATVIILYFISYLRLPQKSGYLIPIIPFVILMVGYFISNRSFKLFCIALTMSSFFFSINLTDSLRGSTHSNLAMQFNIAGQEIFIDPLTGPIYSDFTKRLNKMAYTDELIKKTSIEKRKIVLICGWWYNELLVRSWQDALNPNVLPVFYIDEATIKAHLSKGYEIYYLPEQNLYNDQFSQMNYTDSIAKPYM